MFGFIKANPEQTLFENNAFGDYAETFRTVVPRRVRRAFFNVWGYRATTIGKTVSLAHLKRSPEFQKVAFLLKYHEATGSLVAACDAEKDVVKTIKKYLI